MAGVPKQIIQLGIVIGLGGVLTVLLIQGPLRHAGRFDRSHAGTVELLSGEAHQPVTPRAGADDSPMTPPATGERGVRGRVADASTEAGPSYAASGLRDPLASLVVSPPGESVEPSVPRKPTLPSPPALTIQGIVWGGRVPHAIIDGAVYGVGDVIQGVPIVAIDQHGVTLNYRGTPVAYPLPSLGHMAGAEDEVSRPAARSHDTPSGWSGGERGVRY